MVNALKKAGGDVQLTVYPEAQHDSWTETYNNPKLYEWFLSHSRRWRASSPDDAVDELTAIELRDRIAAGQISSVEATQAALDRISRLDSTIGAIWLYLATGRCRRRATWTGGSPHGNRSGPWPACLWPSRTSCASASAPRPAAPVCSRIFIRRTTPR